MRSSYLTLSKKVLKQRTEEAWQLLAPCRACPRKCGIDRIHDEKRGFCQMGRKVSVASYHPHFGEERCLVGTRASGTIFFSSCNLACVYCQNWEISQLREGREIEKQDLAAMMIDLQNQACHNINLVSPTIWVPQILKALILAVEQGLKIPLVYNSGGYDSVETLKLLDGVVDIYMPDIKYSDDKTGLKYSLVSDYWTVVQKAIGEMYRQVGDLVIEGGIAKRGLLIRHLVLPNGLAGTKKVMEFLANEISKETYVNIMDQYYPANKAFQYSHINRRITSEEYAKAVKLAKQVGLHRFDKEV